MTVRRVVVNTPGENKAKIKYLGRQVHALGVQNAELRAENDRLRGQLDEVENMYAAAIYALAAIERDLTEWHKQ